MPAPTPQLAALLDGPSRWHTIEHHVEVGSTNDLAAASLAAGTPPGVVVVADRQTTGRGRRGRVWEDRPGGASLNASVTVAAPPARQLVPLATGLAVVDAVGALGVDAALKWPNDVLVGGRKLTGILAEGHPAGIVVGMGTNVDLRGAPLDGAVSVAEAVPPGVDVPDRWTVLLEQLRSLDRWLGLLDRGDAAGVVGEYRQRCRTLGHPVVVDLAGGGRVTGRANDVAETGALVLVDADGPGAVGGRLEVTAGDVHHLRPG